MEESEKIAIGKRLRSFAEENFESLAEFGRQFGKDRTFFTPYFNGSSVPGAELLKRLTELGCDINWLLGSSTKEIIKEPKLEYRVKELKEQIKELELQNEQLKKSIEAASNVLNYKVKNKRRR